VGSVTTAWRVLSLRVEERPPVWRVTANILNKLSRTENKGWSSILGLSEVVTTNHLNNWPCYELEACALGLNFMFVYDVSNGKAT